MDVRKHIRGVSIWWIVALLVISASVVYAIAWGLTQYNKELGLRGAQGVADVVTAYIQDITPIDADSDGLIDAIDVTWSLDKPYSKNVNISVEVYDSNNEFLDSVSIQESGKNTTGKTTRISLNQEVDEAIIGRIVVTIS